MATAADLRHLTLSLIGTIEAPHFDRTAFKVVRIYATISPDRKNANFNLSVDEQETWCAIAPRACAPLPSAWGRKGWTKVELSNISLAHLKALLKTAWENGRMKKPANSKRTSSKK